MSAIIDKKAFHRTIDISNTATYFLCSVDVPVYSSMIVRYCLSMNTLSLAGGEFGGGSFSGYFHVYRNGIGPGTLLAIGPFGTSEEEHGSYSVPSASFTFIEDATNGIINFYLVDPTNVTYDSSISGYLETITNTFTPS